MFLFRTKIKFETGGETKFIILHHTAQPVGAAQGNDVHRSGTRRMWVVRYHVWHVRFANRRIPRTCGQCIFLPGVYEKVATVRYVRNVGDIASRSNPHFYAHRDGHDGAYLVVGSHRLLASNASLFTEQPFGAVVSTFDEYLGVAQRRGNGCQPDQRAALRKYVCCDLPELEERFDALAPVAEFGTWSPRVAARRTRHPRASGREPQGAEA